MNNQKGFTIIETLISILLLAIVATAGMTLYHNSDKWMGLVMHRKLANELASAKLEEFKATPYGEIGSPCGHTPPCECTFLEPPCQGTYSTLKVGGLDAVTSSWAVQGIPDLGGTVADYKEVSVTVVWREVQTSEDQKVILTTRIAP